MVTQIVSSARFSGGSHKVKEYPEAASQSFKKGHFVEMNSSGQILEVSSGDVIILGLALSDATGVTNNLVEVAIAQDGTEFEMNVYHSVTASSVTARSNLYTKWAYYNDGDIGRINIGDSDGNDALQITEILTGGLDSVGDTNGRVKCVVLPEVQQLGVKAT